MSCTSVWLKVASDALRNASDVVHIKTRVGTMPKRRNIAQLLVDAPHLVALGRQKCADAMKTLADLEDNTLSQKSFRNDYHEQFDTVKIEWKLQPGNLRWELADPSQLIQCAINASPKLQELYAEALRRHPVDATHPWDLILGFDEFTPGNKILAWNTRKVMCLYMNFTNLGAHALTQSATWFVPVCVRTSLCDQVEGGWSQMLAMFLKHLLLGPVGLSTAGCPVTQ